MNAEYDFSMRLANDSIKIAQDSIEAYREKPAANMNRFRDLLAARAWVGAAKTNLKIAERELHAMAKGGRA